MDISSLPFSFTSHEFEYAQAMPISYGCSTLGYGNDTFPHLQWTGTPEHTQSLVLIMDDPDAPHGTWTHWIVYNLSPSLTQLTSQEDIQNANVGLNSWGKTEYGSPCPPQGTHRYYFRLYALDTLLDLPSGANRSTVENAMRGHIIKESELMGTYSHQPQ